MLPYSPSHSPVCSKCKAEIPHDRMSYETDTRVKNKTTHHHNIAISELEWGVLLGKAIAGLFAQCSTSKRLLGRNRFPVPFNEAE